MNGRSYEALTTISLLTGDSTKMTCYLSLRVVLFSALWYSVSATRFLPSVIWDNVNTLLCCPRNWLVVPRIDIHDILDFVCPTSKLIVKQVNYQTRVGESMNFNLFRREWPGSVTELQQSISNGSIHSFCNASHQDSVTLHTCRNGHYDSFPVKFTHFVFDQSRARYEKYEKDKIYVFYSNGNGLTSSLDSKEAKCTMFFAAHTVAREEQEFDVTYSKQVVPRKCKCDIFAKPTLEPVTTASIPTALKTSPSIPPPTTTKSPTTTEKTTEKMTSTLASTTTKPTKTSTGEKRITSKGINHTGLRNVETTTTRRSEEPPGTEDNFLSVPIFIIIMVATFIFGVICTVLFFQLLSRRAMKKENSYRSSNGYHYHTEQELVTPDNAHAERNVRL